MPIYVIGAKLTDRAAKDDEGFRREVEAAGRVREKHGGRLLGAYVTFGRYDLVFISEYPDQTAALASVETNLSKGLFTLEVSEAMPLEEFLKTK